MAIQGLIGRKVGMTQVYTEAGVLVPVTVIETGPCMVVSTRQPERDGYAAAQLGFGKRKAIRVNKAMQGHLKKAGVDPCQILREFRVTDGEIPAIGSQLTVGDVFKVGDRVQVCGVTKGRGTAGVIKRHGFSGFPGSHGTHEYFRHGGSIGNRSYPGRVFKGKRMAGRLGGETVSMPNLQVVAVRAEENILLVRGAVPGWRNGTVIVSKPKGRRS